MQLDKTKYLLAYRHVNGYDGLTFIKWQDFARDWLKITPKQFTKGVYLFHGFYIGATSNLNKRLYQHCKQALNNWHILPEFSNKFNRLLDSGSKIKIEMLSDNPHEENHYIEKYCKQIVNKYPAKIIIKRHYKTDL